MRTIVLDQPGRLSIADTANPDSPLPGHALVKVLTVGLCGTDLHAFEGTQPFFSYPRILGHELAVEVLAVGDGVVDLKPGDHCAVNPYLTCGNCRACLHGRTNCCPNLKVFGVHTDGGMRDRFVIPAQQLYLCTKLNPIEIALVETLGVGAHAVGRAAPVADDRAIVVGAGPIGLSVIEFLRVDGIDVGVIEKNPKRLDFCRQKHALGRAYPSHEEARKEDASTLVFDCTGDLESMNNAIHLLAHGGKLIFVGLNKGAFSISDPELHRREATILSSRNSTPPEHRRTVELMESGRIDVKSWPAESVTPAQVISHLPQWLDQTTGIVKGIVDFTR